jgi:hypothetical protein
MLLSSLAALVMSGDRSTAMLGDGVGCSTAALCAPCASLALDLHSWFACSEAGTAAAGGRAAAAAALLQWKEGEAQGA